MASLGNVKMLLDMAGNFKGKAGTGGGDACERDGFCWHLVESKDASNGVDAFNLIDMGVFILQIHQRIVVYFMEDGGNHDLKALFGGLITL